MEQQVVGGPVRLLRLIAPQLRHPQPRRLPCESQMQMSKVLMKTSYVAAFHDTCAQQQLTDEQLGKITDKRC